MWQLRKWFNRSAPADRRRKCRPQSLRLRLEQLEDRQLLSTISAVGWMGGDGSNHSTAYAIGGDDALYVSTDGLAFTPLGSYVKQVSAGLDAAGNPQAFIINSDDSVSVVDRNGNFTPLGGYYKQISAGRNNRVYGIGVDDAIWADDGGGWYRLGGYVKQISASLDNGAGGDKVYAIGNQVYTMGDEDGLWVVNGSGQFRRMAPYAKQISADNSPAPSVAGVFAIGTDNSVYFANDIGGVVYLGGYAKQVSGNFDWTYGPQVFVTGWDDSVFVNRLDGHGFIALNLFAREISAPAFWLEDSGAEVYAVGIDHEGYFHDVNRWDDLQQYLLGPSSGQTISAVSWVGSDGGNHRTAYAIGGDDGLYVSTDRSAFTSTIMGSDVKQVSAGLDQYGNPEAFVLTLDGWIFSVDSYGGLNFRGPIPAPWGTPGYIKQISASVNGRVYAIGQNDALWVNYGGPFFYPRGGYVKQISAGLDANGSPQVFGIGGDDRLYLNTDGGGWSQPLGPSARQISADAKGGVYAIDPNNTVYYYLNGVQTTLGGYVKQVSAGLDSAGNSEVFATRWDDSVYVNHRDIWGFIPLGGYAREISAPAFNAGFDGDVVYAVDPHHEGYLHDANGWHDLQQYVLGASGGGRTWMPASGEAIRNPLPDELFALAGDHPGSQGDTTRGHGLDALDGVGHLSRLGSPDRVKVHDSIFASFEAELLNDTPLSTLAEGAER
jgi:hypothetical protein